MHQRSTCFLVKLQIDMYWVMHSSKQTPKELISQHPGRYVMWHIKDMDKITRDYTELGNGSIDYVDVLPDPNESGLEYFYIEQGGNFAHNAMNFSTSSKYCLPIGNAFSSIQIYFLSILWILFLATI